MGEDVQCNQPARSSYSTRWIRKGTTQAIAGSRDQTKLKEYFANLFNDAGWEAGRTLDGLREADDFYLQEVAQAKCGTWSKGMAVLVGNAAYCPSPLSGMGTTAAVASSHILATEIV
jgi:2-polyprenyl-6-methoxyphenol hydroxylase-like FAD-dependent oxidoreductase